ncbi:MAG: hypothetical protein KF869_09825 [Phycisphaeraceae bacterium]|nr:hypothetical protein [Phycisphaeraceae bacterium]
MKMDSHAAFLTTQWSLIDAIQTGRPESAVAMNRLAEIYLPAVYSFLRRNGHPPHAAEDLAQDFFDKVVLGRLLFHNADSTKGSLRSLILKALKNFVIDTVRRRNARGVKRTVSLDAMERADSMLGAEADPGDAFNRQIAGAQLELAIDRCREHFAASGLINHWRLYEVRVLHPATRGASAPALKDCFGEFGFSQARDAAAAVQTVKRALIALFRVVVAESMPPNTPEEEIEAEYQCALAALRLGGGAHG